MTLLTPSSAYLLSQKGLPEEVVSGALGKVERGGLVTDRDVEGFVRSHHQYPRMGAAERTPPIDAKHDPGHIKKHYSQDVELDATSAALTLLNALGPKSARTALDILARQPEAILAELEILLSKPLSETGVLCLGSGNPPVSSACHSETSVGRKRAALQTAENEWPDLPTFLDRRASNTPDPIVAASSGKNAGSS